MMEVQMEAILIIMGFAFAAITTTLLAIVFHARQERQSLAEERDAVELEAITGHLKEEQNQKVVNIR
jgi:beta-lactamase regulating signal transducer with metallopeptidase domain